MWTDYDATCIVARGEPQGATKVRSFRDVDLMRLLWKQITIDII